jgi:MFS family permease
MLHLSEAQRFRRTVAGWCMVVAPLFLLVSAIISPALDNDEATLIGNVAADMDRWYLSAMFALGSIVLAVAAVLGLMHMLRERHATEGHVGGALALLGLFAAMCNTAVALVVWQMAAAGDRGAMVALLDRVNTTTGTFIPFYLFQFGIGLGFIVLAYGLWSARAVHWAMAACIAIGGVLVNVAYPMASVALAIVAAAVLVVGFGSVGRMVLTETDEDWEHTPRWRGFRAPPAAGSP